MGGRLLQHLAHVLGVGIDGTGHERRLGRQAIPMGLSGCSMVPIGDDLVLAPRRDVGEYCPLVRP
jgi:hypothetical protein